MAGIADYVAAAEALIQGVSDDLDKFGSQFTDLKSQLSTALATIAQLQNSPGQITPSDQALLDKAQADLTAAKAKADSMVVPSTPPAPPAP